MGHLGHIKNELGWPNELQADPLQKKNCKNYGYI